MKLVIDSFVHLFGMVARFQTPTIILYVRFNSLCCMRNLNYLLYPLLVKWLKNSALLMYDTHIFFKTRSLQTNIKSTRHRVRENKCSFWIFMYRIEIKFLLKFILDQKLNPHTTEDGIHMRLRAEFILGNDSNSYAWVSKQYCRD